MSDRDTIVVLQRQAQEAEVERLRLVAERDGLLTVLRGVFPYAESRVEDMLEELVLLETGEKQVEQPQAEWRGNVRTAVAALERAEGFLVVTLTPAGQLAAKAITGERGAS